MSVTGIESSGLAPIRPQPNAEQGANNQVSRDVNSPASGGVDRDRVEISAEARALASQSTTEVGAAPPSESSISADRIQDVLGRVRTGFYDQPGVQDVVAQRVLGDLQNP